MANTFEFKVDPKTLKQLEELSEEKQLTLRQTIQEAVDQLWIKTFPVLVYPKPEKMAQVTQILETPPPYLVEKVCQSITGLSDGIYKLQNSDVLVPANWFTQERPAPQSSWFHRPLLLATEVVIQGIFLLAIVIMIVTETILK